MTATLHDLAALTVRALSDLRYAILAPPGAGRAHAAKQVGAAVEAIAQAFPAPSSPVEKPAHPQVNQPLGPSAADALAAVEADAARSMEVWAAAAPRVAAANALLIEAATGGPHPGESSTVARRRADAEAEAGTLLGQEVGDGLDQERADARTAIAILRKALDAGAGLAVIHGAGPGEAVLRPGAAVILSPEQVDLVVRLSSVDDPLTPD